MFVRNEKPNHILNTNTSYLSVKHHDGGVMSWAFMNPHNLVAGRVVSKSLCSRLYTTSNLLTANLNPSAKHLKVVSN